MAHDLTIHGDAVLDHKGATRLLNRLKDSKQKGGRPLERRDIELLRRMGVTDFSGTTFWRKADLHGWSAKGGVFMFRNTNLSQAQFGPGNLGRSDFSGADMTDVVFKHCSTSHANFSRIRIQGHTIDLESGAVQLPVDSLLDGPDNEPGKLVACMQAEERYARIFGAAEFEWDAKEKDKEKDKGNGIVIKHAGKVLGVVKLLVEQSFLATKTARDAKGDVIFWKGGIYALPRAFVTFLVNLVDLKRLQSAHKDSSAVPWPVVDLDEAIALYDKYPHRFGDKKIGRTLVRFINDPQLFRQIDAWDKTLEESNNIVSLKDVTFRAPA